MQKKKTCKDKQNVGTHITHRLNSSVRWHFSVQRIFAFGLNVVFVAYTFSSKFNKSKVINNFYATH